MLILEQAAELIRRTARRLARRPPFVGRAVDSDDIAQALQLRLLSRLAGFDPARLSVAAFVHAVVRQGAQNLTRDGLNPRRYAPGTVSLAQLGGYEPAVAGDDRQRAELVADVTAFVYRLPEGERPIAEALLHTGTVAGAARAVGVRREYVYELLARWRRQARAFGLEQYLENPEPGDAGAGK